MVWDEDREYVGIRSYTVLKAKIRSLDFILGEVDFICNPGNAILERIFWLICGNWMGVKEQK